MKKADYALIIILLTVCAGLFLFSLGGRKAGAAAEVAVNGEVVAVLSLDEDCEYTVSNEYGTNIIVVSGGVVSVSYADCPDAVCVSSSGIYRTGESIVCLPHRLSITIISSQYDKEIDAVTK